MYLVKNTSYKINMYKNVIFIIVDSLCQDNVGIGYSGITTTPFLDSIVDTGIYATNVYSQGPFTEAGTKSLLCGEDTLSNGGYLLRYANADSFITDVFKENGYETYCYMYPNALLSQKSLKCTDHMLYTSGFDFEVIWKQKLVYFLERYKLNLLDEEDINDCMNVIELTLESWKSFFCPVNKSESHSLLSDYLQEYDLEKNVTKLLEQYETFHRDKKAYVFNLFKLKKRHALFSIPSLNMGQMIQNDVIREAFSKHKSFIKSFKKKQRLLNIRNNKYSIIKQLGDVLSFGISRDKAKLMKTYNYYSLLREASDIRLCENSDKYKVVISAKTIFDDLCNKLKERTEDKRFFFVHIEDTHYFSTFFSYDSDDVSIIEEEIKDAEEYLCEVGNKYRGNLLYDFSIRYVDKQIERMFNALNNYGDLQDSLICVTADHGYSFNRYPLRDSVVNNFHKENYHVPFYLINSNQNYIYDGFMLGKDIVATIYDECGFGIPSSVSGISILNNKKKRDNVIIEYMGPGCPDIRNRKAWFSARSRTRVVSVKANVLSNSITQNDIVEVYNLESDPLEEVNIAGKVKEPDKECSRLFKLICDRISEIRSEYK